MRAARQGVCRAIAVPRDPVPIARISSLAETGLRAVRLQDLDDLAMSLVNLQGVLPRTIPKYAPAESDASAAQGALCARALMMAPQKPKSHLLISRKSKGGRLPKPKLGKRCRVFPISPPELISSLRQMASQRAFRICRAPELATSRPAHTAGRRHSGHLKPARLSQQESSTEGRSKKPDLDLEKSNEARSREQDGAVGRASENLPERPSARVGQSASRTRSTAMQPRHRRRHTDADAMRQPSARRPSRQAPVECRISCVERRGRGPSPASPSPLQTVGKGCV
ncbi:hypothetical protein DFH11DRAFT_1543414 [Phellopilus nigrolimitatus]|nr:hypothetical protein DFH11DRAFT_1543414 [Phellopilus nigrolimitatus]